MPWAGSALPSARRVCLYGALKILKASLLAGNVGGEKRCEAVKCKAVVLLGSLEKLGVDRGTQLADVKQAAERVKGYGVVKRKATLFLK